MAKLRAALLSLLLVVSAGPVFAQERTAANLHHGLEVTAQYPQFGIESVDVAVQEWLEDHLAEVTAGFTGIAVRPDFAESADSIVVEYALSQPSPRVVSVMFTTLIFPFMAAHPLTRVDVLSFDLEAGDWLVLSDLFDDPETALVIFSSRAREKVNDFLRNTYENNLPDGLPDDDASWHNEGFVPTPDNYAALVLTETGIRVLFQQYQILPYVFGMPEIEFTLEELSAARPNRALWELHEPVYAVTEADYGNVEAGITDPETDYAQPETGE